MKDWLNYLKLMGIESLQGNKSTLGYKCKLQTAMIRRYHHSLHICHWHFTKLFLVRSPFIQYPWVHLPNGHAYLALTYSLGILCISCLSVWKSHWRKAVLTQTDTHPLGLRHCFIFFKPSNIITEILIAQIWCAPKVHMTRQSTQNCTWQLGPINCFHIKWDWITM